MSYVRYNNAPDGRGTLRDVLGRTSVRRDALPELDSIVLIRAVVVRDLRGSPSGAHRYSIGAN
jgi:hypothetical protein